MASAPRHKRHKERVFVGGAAPRHSHRPVCAKCGTPVDENGKCWCKTLGQPTKETK